MATNGEKQGRKGFLDHTYIMQRNTAKNNLLITQTRMHISNFLTLRRGSMAGHEVVLNALENERVSVSQQGVYTTTDHSTDYPTDYPYRLPLIINQIPFTG